MMSARREGTSLAGGGLPASDVLPDRGSGHSHAGHRSRGAVTSGTRCRQRRGKRLSSVGACTNGGHQTAAAPVGGTAPRGRRI
jgi:hypothetical protein